MFQNKLDKLLSIKYENSVVLVSLFFKVQIKEKTLRKDILFIINPNSGRKKGEDVIRLIPKFLDQNKFNYSYQLTTHPKHAIEISSVAVKDEIDIVVAVGGDGMVNEVFQSLIHTSVVFTIIPAGSGNGVARSLGIDMTVKMALRNLNNLNIAKIDTVSFNGVPFLGISGIGFDGLIASVFSKRSKRGLFSYVKDVLNHYRKFKTSKYVIQSDDESITVDAFIVAIANTQQYGNNAFIAPNASFDDGMLDLVIIKNHSKWFFPLLIFMGFTKSLHHSKYVKYLRSSRFVVNTNYMQAHIDGEPVYGKRENIIEILPSSLNVLV